eukprot:TRINITY_DN21988_c0_g2_i1.p1 TRINITY_DN21988_c0_g2~~TRINITY_DN21988_c0_g2_i1.p1  ORF type:complete len:371 (+),score=108.87 TRINITY_DN21988_c0_g2_i1:94-1113(+)
MQPRQPDVESGSGPRRGGTAAAVAADSGGMWAAVLCFWYVVVSSLLIVINRNIMRRDHFRHPMTLSGMGLAAFSAVAYALYFAGKLDIKEESQDAISGEKWWTRVVPVAVCKAATLAFSNWAYLYLSLGLIQMLKAFTPAIILALATALGVDRPSTGIVVSVLVICCGTALTTSYDPSANPLGLLLQLGAMVTEAVSVVLTQRLLQSHKFGVWEGGLVLAPPGAAALLLTAALFEWRHMWDSGDVSQLVHNPLKFGFAACLGIAVNYLSYAVIRATSSLTFKVVTTMRNIGLICFGVVVFGEVMRALEVVGFGVTLVGFSWYNYIKLAEVARSRRMEKV